MHSHPSTLLTIEMFSIVWQGQAPVWGGRGVPSQWCSQGDFQDSRWRKQPPFGTPFSGPFECEKIIAFPICD